MCIVCTFVYPSEKLLLFCCHFVSKSDLFVFQVMYEGHPEGAQDEMIALTNESLVSELIDGTQEDDDNRPGRCLCLDFFTSTNYNLLVYFITENFYYIYSDLNN